MAEVIGYFRVTKPRMWKSNLQYALLIQPGKLVFVKIGGQFADWLGKAELDRRAGVALQLNGDELLAVDKDNFQITDAEVSDVEVRRMLYSWKTSNAGGGTLKIRGRVNESLEISPGQDLEMCTELLSQALPGKVTRKK